MTVDAIVRLVTHPKDEVTTGWEGNLFGFLHRLMPKTVEGFMTGNVAKSQLHDPPPAPITSGSVHTPSEG